VRRRSPSPTTTHERECPRARPCRRAGRSGIPAPPSPCNKASSGASGFLWVFAGSWPIALSSAPLKATRSEGPSLHRHYPASSVLRPSPTSAASAVLATALGFITPSTTDLPRLPAPPFQRAVPITPVDRDGCTCRLLPHPLGPSPNSSRVGIHKFPFEMLWGGGEEIASITADASRRSPQCKF
jgi:hypothetical protein